MPLYEFGCPRCGKGTERFLPTMQRGVAFYCQQCQIALKRLITPVHLHGSPNMPND